MAKSEEEVALDIEIAYAQRKERQAIRALAQDIRVFGAADRNRQQRAKAALTYVNGLIDRRHELRIARFPVDGHAAMVGM